MTFQPFRLILLIYLLTVACFGRVSRGQVETRSSIELISETVVLLPGPESEWIGKVDRAPGLRLLTITYGKGGITNEGYPGFPGGIYSPYKEGRGSARIQVWVDDDLIVQAMLPPVPSEKGLLRQSAVPFVWPDQETQEIRLAAILGGADDPLEITRAVLSPVRLHPVPHTLQQALPAQPLMDLVSWCEYVFYSQPPGGLGPKDIRDKTIRPSWKAGFNMIWTVLNAPGGGIAFPWDEKATGMPKPSTFVWSDDARWQVEGYRRHLGYLRERNMLEMLYYPGAFGGVPPEVGGPGQKASQIRTADKIFNSLLYDRRGLCDAISNERYCATNNSLTGSRQLALAHVNQLLESNPGAFAVNYISGVDGARPGMVGDFPNGLEPYSSGYFEEYDDALMFAPDPWWLRIAGGAKYRWIEMWAKDGDLVAKHRRKRPTFNYDGGELKDSWYAGHIGEDYMVKQMNDIARMRLLDPARCKTLTGMTWYNDGFIISDSNFEMAHAVSQDPVRAAVAGQLRTLGQDGKVRSLYPYSTKSHFMQNNYLALFLPEGKAKTELFYDLQRTAHFTPFSYRVTLGREFLNITGGAGVAAARSVVLERGGYRAVVRCELELQSGPTRITETRTYEMIADSPYLAVTIEDQLNGPPTPLANTLMGQGFDKLLVDGKEEVREAGALPLPKVAVLRDSSGLRPDVALLFLEAPAKTTLDWKPGQSLIAIRGEAKPLRLAVAVPTDLYALDSLPRLAEDLSPGAAALPWKDGPMMVTNRSTLPRTHVVTLKGADDRPYLVEEEGWWTFRGAQVSKQQRNTDFLKLYLQPQKTATILPWDFINGLARPGWGCQYILALSQVEDAADGAACRVKVHSETPMIFAPRIEFSFPIAAATLDGNPWHYFDGQDVFLPQNRGKIYHLQVVRGPPTTPHLSRTYVNVKAMTFTDNEFTIESRGPPWRPDGPDGLRLTAQIEHPNRVINKVTGGKRLSSVNGRSIIHIEPGTLRIRFR